MPRLVWEIDGQPRKNRVHRLDFAEAPASVHGVAALDQLQQRFNVLAADLAGGNQFLQLFFHKFSKNSLAMKRMSLLGSACSKTKRNCRARSPGTRESRRLRGKPARSRLAVPLSR